MTVIKEIVKSLKRKISIILPDKLFFMWYKQQPIRSLCYILELYYSIIPYDDRLHSDYINTMTTQQHMLCANLYINKLSMILQKRKQCAILLDNIRNAIRRDDLFFRRIKNQSTRHKLTSLFDVLYKVKIENLVLTSMYIPRGDKLILDLIKALSEYHRFTNELQITTQIIRPLTVLLKMQQEATAYYRNMTIITQANTIVNIDFSSIAKLIESDIGVPTVCSFILSTTKPTNL